MALSLLQIVNRACDQPGLDRPGSVGVVASTVPQTRQMVALLTLAGTELVQSHQWTTLITTASITLATASSSYSLPTDFDRVIDNAGWDHTNNFPLTGSIAPQRHQAWLSSAVVGPTTRKEYRLFLTPGASSTVYVHPAPTAVEVLKIPYVRNTWITTGVTPATEFAADSDTTVFNPYLLISELKMRFKSAKGLDAADAIYERTLMYDRLLAADIGASMLDMGGPRLDGDILNVPDGNWDLT